MDKDRLARKLIEQRVEDLKEEIVLLDARREKTRIELQNAEVMLDRIILRQWLARSTDAA